MSRFLIKPQKNGGQKIQRKRNTIFIPPFARKYRRNPESSHYTAYSCFCSVSAVFVYFSPDSAVTVIRMLNLDFLDFHKQIEIFFIMP